MRLGLVSRTKSFSLFAVGKFFFLGSQLLIVVIINRFGSVVDAGIYGFGLALSAPIFIFVGMNTRLLLASEGKESVALSDYFLLRIMQSAASFLIVILFAFVLKRQEILLVLVLVSVVKVVDGFHDILYGEFQRRSEFFHIFLSQFLRGVLGTLAFLFFYISFGLTAGLLAMLIVWLNVLVIQDIRNAGPIKLVSNSSIRFDRVYKIVKMAFPIGIAASLGSLVSNVPIYFIQSNAGLIELGIFVSLNYLAQSFTIFATALWEPALPRFADARLSSDRLYIYRELAINTIMGSFIALFIYIGSSLFGKQVISILYSEFYLEYYEIFTVLIVSICLRFVFGIWSIAAVGLRVTWAQIPILITQLIVTVVSVLLLLPMYGLIGAAWSIVISVAVGRVLFIALVLKYCKSMGSNEES